jgi:hypothetical protein
MTQRFGPAVGPWHSSHPSRAVVWFASVHVPWWIAGGWALDLFLGRETRPHKDLDVGILRKNAPEILEALRGWDFFEAQDGALFRLDAGEVPRACVNSLWGRPRNVREWTFELLLDDSADDQWVFRRDPKVRIPLAHAIRHTAEGIPYLAPEIQLLYKARDLRPEDQADFKNVAPALEGHALRWLQQGLLAADPGHPWLSVLEGLIRP